MPGFNDSAAETEFFQGLQSLLCFAPAAVVGFTAGLTGTGVDYNNDGDYQRPRRLSKKEEKAAAQRRASKKAETKATSGSDDSSSSSDSDSDSSSGGSSSSPRIGKRHRPNGVGSHGSRREH